MNRLRVVLLLLLLWSHRLYRWWDCLLKMLLREHLLSIWSLIERLLLLLLLVVLLLKVLLMLLLLLLMKILLL